MDEAILQNRLRDLVGYVDSLDVPREARGQSSSTGKAVPAQRVRRSAQELLDSLSFSVKYLIFDLEATRRENEILRSIITQGGE